MADILVVDDDAAVRSTIARALSGDGHTVAEAGDGEAALDALRTSAFALLVTDVQMPGMDGLTLAERAGAMAGGLRVVVISALEADAVRKAKLPAGTRWVAKPFTLERIRAEVRAALA
jgi:CheY-like chemotaxis protein